jgi:hypothetical protein
MFYIACTSFTCTDECKIWAFEVSGLSREAVKIGIYGGRQTRGIMAKLFLSQAKIVLHELQFAAIYAMPYAKISLYR